jgi:hypothetical protein
MKTSTKKDKKPLYILAGFIVFFIIFIYAITRPSLQSKAIAELEVCYNIEEVKSVWLKYKSDLHKDEEFVFETRKRLDGFKLTEKDLNECIKWLPPAPISINIIVVPDLSRRIKEVNGQIENDKIILKAIWESFKEKTKLKQDSKDRLIIDVTDIDQARGQFGKFANDLQFDLSSHKEKSNRLFFTNEKTELFDVNISKMYASASQKPLGADYRFYIRRYLRSKINKSTLFDSYINKLIFITDGYLEAENNPADTKIDGYQKELYQSVLDGNILDVIKRNNLNIPAESIDLSNIEVLVCELNERKSGIGYDFEILQTYWIDWFKRMGVKNPIVINKEIANKITISSVNNFIQKE